MTGKKVMEVEKVRNFIREHGYAFKKEADKVTIWKKAGVATPVMLPRRDVIPVTHARSLLLMTHGVTEREVDAFLVEYAK